MGFRLAPCLLPPLLPALLPLAALMEDIGLPPRFGDILGSLRVLSIFYRKLSFVLCSEYRLLSMLRPRLLNESFFMKVALFLLTNRGDE